MIRLIAIAVILSNILPGASYSGQLGTMAPDFSAADMNNKTVMLNQFRGKVVFLNFWAPWCIPCREELPALEVLHRKYLREGLAIIAISLDTSGSDVAAFLRNVPVTFPVLVDKNADASDAYCVSGLPTGFLIDRNGIIRYKHRGFGKEYVSRYEKEFIELLNEQ